MEDDDLCVHVTVKAKADETEAVIVKVRETVSLGEIKALLAESVGRPEILEGKFVKFMPNGDTVNVSDSVKVGSRRTLIYEGAPLYPIPEEVLYSVEDFDEFDPDTTISTPRSLRACEIEGVLPDELIYAPAESFLSQSANNPMIAHLRRDFFEAFRQDCLVSVRRAREMLVEGEEAAAIEAAAGDAGGEHGGSPASRGGLGVAGALVAGTQPSQDPQETIVGHGGNWAGVLSPTEMPTVLHFFKEMRKFIKIDKMLEYPLQVPEPDYGGVTPAQHNYPSKVITKERTFKDLHWTGLNKSRRAAASASELPKPRSPDFTKRVTKDARHGENAVLDATDEAEMQLAKLQRMPGGGAEKGKGLQIVSAARGVEKPRWNIKRLQEAHADEFYTMRCKVVAAEVQRERIDFEHDKEFANRKVIDDRHLEAQARRAALAPGSTHLDVKLSDGSLVAQYDVNPAKVTLADLKTAISVDCGNRHPKSIRVFHAERSNLPPARAQMRALLEDGALLIALGLRAEGGPYDIVACSQNVVEKRNFELAKRANEEWTKKQQSLHSLMLGGEDARNDYIAKRMKEEHAREKRISQLRDLRTSGYARVWAERRIQWHYNMQDTGGRFDAWRASVANMLDKQDKQCKDVKARQKAQAELSRELRELRTACAELMRLREKRRQDARRKAIADALVQMAAEAEAEEQRQAEENKEAFGTAGEGLGLANSWEWSQPASRFGPGSMKDLSSAVGFPTSKIKSSEPGSIHAPGRRTKVLDHPHVQPKLRGPCSGSKGMPRFDFPRNAPVSSHHVASHSRVSTSGSGGVLPSLGASASAPSLLVSGA